VGGGLKGDEGGRREEGWWWAMRESEVRGRRVEGEEARLEYSRFRSGRRGG